MQKEDKNMENAFEEKKSSILKQASAIQIKIDASRETLQLKTEDLTLIMNKWTKQTCDKISKELSYVSVEVQNNNLHYSGSNKKV